MVGSKEHCFSYSKGLQAICFKRKLSERLPPSLDETNRNFSVDFNEEKTFSQTSSNKVPLFESS